MVAGASPVADDRRGGGGVDVWRVDLNAGPAGVAPVQDEADRAARLRDSVGRARFLASRAWLRVLLGQHLGADAADLRFVRSERGKPSLVDGDGIRFSLSRSGAVGLVAVARHQEVGVDIEQNRHDVDHGRVARQQFASAEVEHLEHLAEPARGNAFFALWTRKEAVLKASGAGIGDGLAGFDGREDRVADRWEVVTLDVGSGFAAALATDGPGGAMRLRW